MCLLLLISITIKHEQHIESIKAFIYLVELLIFLGPGEGGQKKLMGCGLLGGSASRLTL